jgi:hypothetical protein
MPNTLLTRRRLPILLRLQRKPHPGNIIGATLQHARLASAVVDVVAILGDVEARLPPNQHPCSVRQRLTYLQRPQGFINAAEPALVADVVDHREALIHTQVDGNALGALVHFPVRASAVNSAKDELEGLSVVLEIGKSAL